MREEQAAMKLLEPYPDCLLCMSVRAQARMSVRARFTQQELDHMQSMDLKPGRDATDLEGIMNLEVSKSVLSIGLLQPQGVADSLNRALHLAQALGTRSTIPRILYQWMRLHVILCEHEPLLALFPQVVGSSDATHHLKHAAEDLLLFGALIGGVQNVSAFSPEVQSILGLLLYGHRVSISNNDRLYETMMLILKALDLFDLYHLNPPQVYKNGFQKIQLLVQEINAVLIRSLSYDLPIDYWDDMIPDLMKAMSFSLYNQKLAFQYYHHLKSRSRNVSPLLEMLLDLAYIQIKCHGRDFTPFPVGFADRLLDRSLHLTGQQKLLLGQLCQMWFPAAPFVLEGIFHLGDATDKIPNVRRNGLYLGSEKVTLKKKSYPARVMHQFLVLTDPHPSFEADENHLRQLRVHREYLNHLGKVRFNIAALSDRLRQLFMDNLFESDVAEKGMRQLQYETPSKET